MVKIEYKLFFSLVYKTISNVKHVYNKKMQLYWITKEKICNKTTIR